MKQVMIVQIFYLEKHVMERGSDLLINKLLVVGKDSVGTLLKLKPYEQPAGILNLDSILSDAFRYNQIVDNFNVWSFKPDNEKVVVDDDLYVIKELLHKKMYPDYELDCFRLMKLYHETSMNRYMQDLFEEESV